MGQTNVCACVVVERRRHAALASTFNSKEAQLILAMMTLPRSCARWRHMKKLANAVDQNFGTAIGSNSSKLPPKKRTQDPPLFTFMRFDVFCKHKALRNTFYETTNATSARKRNLICKGLQRSCYYFLKRRNFL
jgi:hypothetical protein